jgi:hypothetical protein
LFFTIFTQFYNLRHIFICGAFISANLNRNRVLQKFLREFLHLLRPCGAKHDWLPFRPNLLIQKANLGFKSVIQHPIRLIQNHHWDFFHIQISLLNQISEPARRAYHNMHFLANRTNLLGFIDSSVQTHRFYPAETAGFNTDQVYLLG